VLLGCRPAELHALLGRLGGVDKSLSALELVPRVLVFAVPLELCQDYVEDVVCDGLWVFRAEDFVEEPDGSMLAQARASFFHPLPDLLTLFNQPTFSSKFLQRACERFKGWSRAKWNPVLLARELNPTCLVKLPRFTRNELIILVAIGVLTPLIDDRVEHFLVTFFANISGSVNVFDYTGGPLNSDLLIAWEQYGGVLAGFLVRKPGAATLAMTINGFGQFFRDGFVGPHHLFYGFAGLGADVVFWAFRYKRYDMAASVLAGIAAQFFWVPFTYAYHVTYLYPLSFIGTDLVTRVIGGAVGNGLLGAGIGLAILEAGRRAGLHLGSGKLPEMPSAPVRFERA